MLDVPSQGVPYEADAGVLRLLEHFRVDEGSATVDNVVVQSYPVVTCYGFYLYTAKDE